VLLRHLPLSFVFVVPHATTAENVLGHAAPPGPLPPLHPGCVNTVVARVCGRWGGGYVFWGGGCGGRGSVVVREGLVVGIIGGGGLRGGEG
jgi:hypothetical protein